MKRTTGAAGFLLIAFYFGSCIAAPGQWHLMDFVNLIFHEAGHTIFRVFGWEFLAVAGGTIMQLLIPYGIAAYFFGTGQRFSAALTLLWAAQSMANVYWYANDALTMNLELLGGENAIHDWNYMIRALDLIMYAARVAQFIDMLAWLTLFTAVGLAGYLLYSSEWNSMEPHVS